MDFLGRTDAATWCGATLLLLAFAPAGPAQAAAFKCVTADGTVEYRELADKTMTCTALRSPPKPSSDPAAEMKKLQDRVEQVDAAKTAGKDDARSKNCEQARANADVLKGEKSVVQKDADGNEVVLGKEQRADALAQTQKDIDYWCN